MIYATRMQIKLNAPLQRVFQALTESRALELWFCEHADVAPAEGRYDFWGRYTPQAPDREAGRHPIVEYEAGRRISFDWAFPGAESRVTLSLLTRDDSTTILTVRHTDKPDAPAATKDYYLEDFWFFALENLRRYLDGKPSDQRTDFTNPMKGDIQHQITIDAPASRVFEVLTDPQEVNRWIATNAAITPEVDGDYDLGWGVPAAKIVELEPNKKLSHVHQYPGPNGMHDMVITWTLEESSGKTRLTFVQSGFDSDEDNSGLYTGWNMFINYVRSVAEYGADWQPPLVPLAPDAVGYAASIVNAQDQIVEEVRA